MQSRLDPQEPIVITGIGLATSLGRDRETVWQAVRRGERRMRLVEEKDGVPAGLISAAVIDDPTLSQQRSKAIQLAERTAHEALSEAKLLGPHADRSRLGCAISTHMGDTSFVAHRAGVSTQRHGSTPWYMQFVPSTASTEVGRLFGLHGPRLCHSAACASGAVELISAVRALRSDQCDAMLVGGTEVLHPLYAAGFRQMRVLGQHDDPCQACRPFDSQRNGFVLGEGSGMLVLERLSHALDRGAKIYAEVIGTALHAEAQHLTHLDQDAEVLTHTLVAAMRKARLAPDDVGYINAHGTGTEQNDVCEAAGIRRAFGHATPHIPVSATKSMFGHLLNAAASTEIAITALALRDGFMPPTANLTDPDPRCALDHLPMIGRTTRPQIAVKLAVAFGGHVAAVILRRWSDAKSGFGYPQLPQRVAA